MARHRHRQRIQQPHDQQGHRVPEPEARRVRPLDRFRPDAAVHDGRSPFSIASGDFDGDGDLDIVAISRTDGNLRILSNKGLSAGVWRGFDSLALLPTGTFSLPYHVATADLNEDGRTDIAVADLNGNRVALLINDGTGSAAPFPATHGAAGFVFLDQDDGVTAGAGNVTCVDLDDDANLDLVVSYRIGAGGVILWGDGDGTFDSRTPTALDPAIIDQTNSSFAADLDADGDEDLLVCTSSFASGEFPVRAYVNKGTSAGTWLGFEEAVPYSIGTSSGVPAFVSCGLAIVDADDDGKLEFVASVSTHRHIAFGRQQ